MFGWLRITNDTMEENIYTSYSSTYLSNFNLYFLLSQPPPYFSNVITTKSVSGLVRIVGEITAWKHTSIKELVFGFLLLLEL